MNIGYEYNKALEAEAAIVSNRWIKRLFLLDISLVGVVYILIHMNIM